jgi:hypothetical protein
MFKIGNLDIGICIEFRISVLEFLHVGILGFENFFF